ncbi:MAG: hypothetical protein Q8N85_05245, partial [Candidatus Omnitrophota bacterium]|nr:hypothetical protein [Candidatus Omnitrophota bacterium]
MFRTKRIKPNKAVILGGLILFFFLFPALSFAETPAQKAARKAKQAAEALLPVIPPPKYKLPLFKVNSPIRLKNSTLQVFAGKKFPSTPIFVNNKLVIPTNKYNTWYYEYPLTNTKLNKIVVSSSPITLKQPPYFQVFNLDTLTTLNVDPPKITKIRVDPSTREIILTIQDPPGVLSYNVYYADSLSQSTTTTPFILAQPDYPVSGSGSTEWRDNGTFTKIPPLDPKVKMRFYRLEVARVDMTSFQLTGLIPADGTVILASAKIDIQASVFNPQNEILWYQFSLGGTVIQPWLTLNTYTWETTVSDTGAVSITCEVKNNAGNRQVSKTVAYRIVDPTAEEVLRKVVDNYGLITDKTMDVTVTSKFNNEPFGETI